VLASALAVPGDAGAASRFTPPGLYDPEVYFLDNGLRVILNPRHHARNVALRLVVDVGFWDFPCETRETPHVLEHLFFSGTDAHSEQELDDRITAHGGYWNAFTEYESTYFQVDIHSAYTPVALNTLFEVVTRSTMSADQVDAAKKVVAREYGGEPGAIQRSLERFGIGKDAHARAYELAGFECPSLLDLRAVDRTAILVARSRYYVPGNMTLILVGDFDPVEMRQQLSTSFAKLAGEPPEHDRQWPRTPQAEQEARSRFSPIVGSDHGVGLAYRVPGYVHVDYSALRLLEAYLAARLYAIVRVERALAYAPEVTYDFYQDAGLFYLYSDADEGDLRVVRRLIGQELERVTAGVFDDDLLSDGKRGLLLSGAQGLESNASIADYYVRSLGELDRFGRLRDEEAELEEIAQADLVAVARRYLGRGGGIEVRVEPTLGYGSLLLLLAAVGLVLALLLLRVVRGAGRMRRG
jgi:predicted Zn-dependent peptidase